MHLLLTDRLACPRCGPEFGLILFAEKVVEHRVLEGELGCSNCRDRYPVRGGFGDLRPPPRRVLSGGSASPESWIADSSETLRLAALLGVAEGPGTLLIKGPSARYARALADVIGQVEIVTLDPRLENDPETPGVSRMVSGARIPFFTGSFLGVLLGGGTETGDLEEAARVVGLLGRVVILDVSPRVRPHVENLGLSVLLDEGGVVVAQKTGRQTLPLVTLRGP